MNTCLMLRNSWGWGGVGWDVYVPCTCTHVQCYATTEFLAGMFTFLAFAHMFNATQRLCFLLGYLRSLIKYNFFDKKEKKFGRF